MFEYVGLIPASKSIFNRALVIQSYNPHFKPKGASQCDDVVHMKSALNSLKDKLSIYCGSAGTVLRFMALRASRESGLFILEGEEKLFSRPQRELTNILAQLGVKAHLASRSMSISSEGWKKPQAPLRVDFAQSSQFASGIVLNSFNLDFDLEIDLGSEEKRISETYFAMTLAVCAQAGLRYEINKNILHIPKHQSPLSIELPIEPDVSSCFAVAACAAVAGKLKVEHFPFQSLQPDLIFVDILQKMGVQIEEDTHQNLCVQKTEQLYPVSVNLKDAPDLFPVLAALCACIEGQSQLYGAPHLRYKESDRIAEISALLKGVGVEHLILDDGIKIKGSRNRQQQEFAFNPRADHRLAMAAQVLKMSGHNIRILNPQVINKSFPEFWSIVGEPK